MARVTGTCHICGTEGPLTFEHIPPAVAYNGDKVVLSDVEALLSGKPDDEIPKRVQQRGMGSHVLCGACNNNTGSWYSNYYGAFAYQAMRYMQGGSRSAMANVALPYDLFPLRVIKQVAAMMLALNGPKFQAAHPELVRFVLSKEARYWPTSAGRLYMAYLDSSAARQSGVTAMLDLEDSRETLTYSEMSYRPFSFILTHNRPLRNTQMLDITPFAQRSINEWTTLHFRAPVLSIPRSALPGMFEDATTGRHFRL